MAIYIEVEHSERLRALTELLSKEGFEIHAGGDGASVEPPFDPDRRFREFREHMSRFQGTAPPGYRFDRDEIHDRHS